MLKWILHDHVMCPFVCRTVLRTILAPELAYQAKSLSTVSGAYDTFTHQAVSHYQSVISNTRDSYHNLFVSRVSSPGACLMPNLSLL